MHFCVVPANAIFAVKHNSQSRNQLMLSLCVVERMNERSGQDKGFGERNLKEYLQIIEETLAPGVNRWRQQPFGNNWSQV